jgi:hypothetical protein
MELNELAKALSLAQAEMRNAEKDAANPFFKSSYTTLAAAWDACREPLTKHGLSVVQMPGSDEQGLTVTTVLLHSSGQSMSSTLRLYPKDSSPQSMGSAISYGRRYSLMAMIGLASADDDDDGNQASQPSKAYTPKQASAPKPQVQSTVPLTTTSESPKPITISNPPLTTRSKDLPIDDQDRARLSTVGMSCGWTGAQIAAKIQSVYGKTKVTELTRDEFNELLKHIETNSRMVK